MRQTIVFSLAIASLFAALGAHSEPQVSIAAGRATIHNEQVAVVCDLHRGTYDVVDLASRQVAIKGARAEAEGLSSAAEGLTRTATGGDFSDELGAGKRLLLECAAQGQPTLLLEFRVYAERPFLVLRAGLRNTTKDLIHLKQFRPLAGGDLFPDGGAKTDWRTLNAPSGGIQTQVTRDECRMSTNDLLITFKQRGQRRSVVLGGLKTSEFPKSAGIGPDGGPAGARSATLARILPGARLAAYRACGDSARYTIGGPEKLTPTQGSPFNWSSSLPDTTLNSLLFDNVAVQLQAEGLDPAKRYAVGLAWWDFDDNERIESVIATGADGKPQTLIAQHKLPAFANRGQYPEQIGAVVPATTYADGKLRLSVARDGGKSNAVVSEVWLWEIGANDTLPQTWRDGHTVGKYAQGLPTKAMLEASDPVGKRVDPGATYLPEDSFYLDCGTANPFAALEQYGWQLRLANHANPNPYDFPTICAWYAGVWNTPGAQNHPDKSKYKIATTPGLVEEIEQAGKLGFLKYSRLAGRIVPDNYTPNNPQGWSDDAHWQKEGFYVAPYETSQKWGKAMQASGGLAITYFQAPMLSDDFRKAHPEMLIGHDPTKPFDYTNKAAQAHLRQVYAAMRGGISGMMFDYCDELWNNVARAGGFADPYATSADFYRTCLRFAKEGLGPNSWIHERSIGSPPADLSLGFADSQRTSGDTDRIDPAMISRSGLRWYKNRVVLAYDMDSKELNHGWQTPNYKGSDEDGRRMLTMAYVAASRLLLADSLRDLKPEALRDLERTFPYHTAPKSARPVDAFTHEGWPRVYDFEVTPKWHQVTLFNNTEPSRAETITVSLSGDTAEGALGLDPKKQYHVYDFWNDRYVGCLKGSETLSEVLRPGEARMLAVHEVEAGPQFIATNRHLMQGYLDLAKFPAWDAKRLELSGAAKVVGGETYKVVIALNGYKVGKAPAGCKVEALEGGKLAVLSLDRAANETVEWVMGFTK